MWWWSGDCVMVDRVSCVVDHYLNVWLLIVYC